MVRGLSFSIYHHYWGASRKFSSSFKPNNGHFLWGGAVERCGRARMNYKERSSFSKSKIFLVLGRVLTRLYLLLDCRSPNWRPLHFFGTSSPFFGAIICSVPNRNKKCRNAATNSGALKFEFEGNALSSRKY